MVSTLALLTAGTALIVLAVAGLAVQGRRRGRGRGSGTARRVSWRDLAGPGSGGEGGDGGGCD
jgi:hypothetical protein